MLHINKKGYANFFSNPLQPLEKERNSPLQVGVRSCPRDSDRERGRSGNSPYDRYRVDDRMMIVIRGLRNPKMTKLRVKITVFLLECLNRTILLLQLYLQILKLNPKP